MYVTLKSEAGRSVDVPAEGHLEIYRDADRTHEVVVREVDGEEENVVGLDVYDISVSSRGTDQTPKYVEVTLEDGQVYVVDHGQSEGVELEGIGNESYDVKQGERKAIHRDSRIEVGYDTTLSIKVDETAEDVPLLEYIDQCQKWLQNGGQAQLVLDEGQKLVTELRMRGKTDSAAAREAHDRLKKQVNQIRNQVNRGNGDKPVEDDISRRMNGSLENLRRIYNR